ncbi:MAG: RND transporter [Candidatus Parabeggiatoa sp. nov. 1]|nr:MAG: RND transporter [Gammaproteobacteria bacterium]
MRWLDKLPWDALIIGSLLLGLAPFMPEPHLIEKLRMLFQGTLSRPIDIFDLLMHGALPLLLLLKIGRTIQQRHISKPPQDNN